MFMGDVQTVKKFEAKIPIAIWREWEDWLDSRGNLNNTQILCGLLRLFLACPEELQLRALFGKADAFAVGEIPYPQQVIRSREVLHKNTMAHIEGLRQKEIHKIASDEDSAEIAEIRRKLGPDDAVREKPKHGKARQA
jgi:hypothetical protein